jgi:acyl-CoA thioester hydrolase
MAEETRFYHNAEGRPVVETRFRVRFYETDAMGIVHHAAYITWFEVGRSAFTRAIGYPYSQMSAEGVDLAVVDVAARYHQPARYDDEVVVAACLQELRSRSLTFTYEVRRAADAALLVTGSSRHISVDRQGRAVRMPNPLQRRLLARTEPPLEG